MNLKIFSIAVITATICFVQQAHAQSCMGLPMQPVAAPTYGTDPSTSLPGLPTVTLPSFPDPGSGTGGGGGGTGGTGGTIGLPGVPGTYVQPAEAGTCTSGTDLSDNGLSRQTAGKVDYSGDKFGLKAYIGDMTTLANVGQGSWPLYHTGYSVTPNINVGCYIALEFTPTSPGSVEFTNDPSFGDAGLISLSTVPGKFSVGDATVICSLNRGAGNSLYIATTDRQSNCPVEVGQTYYVNMADPGVQNGCVGQTSSCVATFVSYSMVTGS